MNSRCGFFGPVLDKHPAIPGRSSLKVPLAKQVEWLRRVDPGTHADGTATAGTERTCIGRWWRRPVDARVKPGHNSVKKARLSKPVFEKAARSTIGPSLSGRSQGA